MVPHNLNPQTIVLLLDGETYTFSDHGAGMWKIQNSFTSSKPFQQQNVTIVLPNNYVIGLGDDASISIRNRRIKRESAQHLG